LAGEAEGGLWVWDATPQGGTARAGFDPPGGGWRTVRNGHRGAFRRWHDARGPSAGVFPRAPATDSQSVADIG